jgi:hypothetical protein
MTEQLFLDIDKRPIAENWGIWKEAARMLMIQGLDPLSDGNTAAMLACQCMVADQLDAARSVLQDIAASATGGSQ